MLGQPLERILTEVETLIIGGGLSGLALALRLAVARHDYFLIEARDRLGGRILSAQHGAGQFDLGPAWYWPGQPRMAELVRELDLHHFEQYSKGDLIFEDNYDRVQRLSGHAMMQGSFRIDGTMMQLVNGLSRLLRPSRVLTGAQVIALQKSDSGVGVTLADQRRFMAKRVVFALPPRLASGLIFEPDLSEEVRRSLGSVSTWMAGQSKAVAVYSEPFWRDSGASGDAISRIGPMAEIHDASPMNGGPYALFGFLGIPPSARQDVSVVREAIVAQLTRIFGPKAQAPLAVKIKDWARDAFTATDADQRPLAAHPRYCLPDTLKGVWNGRVLFAGTEVANQFGGYLEGALEAADYAAAQILRTEV